MKLLIQSISFILLILIIALVYFVLRETYYMKKPIESPLKTIGLVVNGVGNGHITQAKTVYDILLKKYKIPIVVIWGRDDGCDSLFKNSHVAYHKMFSNPESISQMNKSKAIKDFF